MWMFLKSLATKWNNWCGDRDKVIAIQSQLTAEGYYGETSRLQNVRLVAIKRPGWVQIYRFEVTARLIQEVEDDRPDPEPIEKHLLGLVHDDGRARTRVCLFESEVDRKTKFREWSDGLICLRGSQGLLET